MRVAGVTFRDVNIPEGQFDFRFVFSGKLNLTHWIGFSDLKWGFTKICGDVFLQNLLHQSYPCLRSTVSFFAEFEEL